MPANRSVVRRGVGAAGRAAIMMQVHRVDCEFVRLRDCRKAAGKRRGEKQKDDGKRA